MVPQQFLPTKAGSLRHLGFWLALYLYRVSSISTDAMSLLDFKQSVVKDPANLLSDWIPADDTPCNWFGVTCDKFSGRVTALNITGDPFCRSFLPKSVYGVGLRTGNSRALAGTLASSIGNLMELRILSLSCNAFSGEIPVEVSRLRFLEIVELQGNNFSGCIPDQISVLSSLRVLNLAFNSFSGPIPAGVVECTSLRYLNLEGNLLNGTIPGNLIGLSGLEVIILSYNQLSGGITVNPLSRCESLEHLHLSGNFLVDRIPPDIGNCSNLRSILLSGNILEGRIPAEIGRISELRILDVSRNSLTDRIPNELANCAKLSVLVLTNLLDFLPDDSSIAREEFNAFVGGIPSELFLIPNLRILWAPRANLRGQLPVDWSGFCRLHVLNLGQNYLTGSITEGLGLCRNLSFLDLSSNCLQGHLPAQLQVQCMVYFNISGNSLTGLVPAFTETNCSNNVISSLISLNQSINLFDEEKLDENLESMYSAILQGSSRVNNPFSSILAEKFVVLHDFSWNSFVGAVPSVLIGDSLLADHKPSYGLLLNNNLFNGSFPGSLFLACGYLQSFAVNVSVNQISGEISPGIALSCSKLKALEAAYNHLEGSIPPDIGNLQLLLRLDLRGNHLNGTVPNQLGKLKDLQWILLGQNNLTGEIPAQLSQLGSLMILDLAGNSLTGTIPASLPNATHLRVVLLDHNEISGEIPSSFSTLGDLAKLDVSYNNLSGSIPYLKYSDDCSFFKGNSFIQPCPYSNLLSPAGHPYPLPVQTWGSRNTKRKAFEIAMVVFASVVVLILLILVLTIVWRRRKLVKLPSQRRKVVVAFTDTPSELNYENVVRATGNFSIQNLIGTGGFGATYKAELVPGFLIAVKKLSIGRFQGVQQFDAEIKTLGRIRHKNLVTLIGYHRGESEMFLIYNYLSGGNLESFIHDTSGKNVRWPMIHKIALDIANALAYLHYSCVPRVVHRDIKPSNILLDEELNAYLSDFGLARLLEGSVTHATTDVAGTFGYVAPEYATTCKVTDKADVYSFGVVLLELISGKRSFDPSFSDYGNGFNIVAWGKLLIKEGRSSEIFSPALWEAGPQDLLVGMLGLALACTVESLSIRPSMRQVVERLQLKHS